MTPNFVDAGFVVYDPAKQLKAQDAAARTFASAASQFLCQAFPHVEPKCIEDLRGAFVGLICCGTEEQLADIERGKKMQMAYPPFKLPTDEERLIELIERRDKLSEQTSAIEDGISKMPEDMRAMMKAASLAFFKDQLTDVEEQISTLQESIERGAHAVGPNLEANGEESANI